MGTLLLDPDASASGLVANAPDPCRYEHAPLSVDDLYEVPTIVSKWISPRARVLDVGCGTGSITAFLSEQNGANVLGVEPNPHRSAAARSRGLNVVTGVVDDALFRQHAPFDVVLFTDVLEHLVDPADHLLCSARGLAPDGVIIASVPNVAHWSIRIRLLFGRFDYQEQGPMDATHLRWFTRRSFQALFERHGFKVEAYAATAGVWLNDYSRFPFNLLPGSWRRNLVRLLSQASPTLFGCQHVIRARRA